MATLGPDRSLERVTFLACGATTVLPWLSFISAVDFFDSIFPGARVQYITAVVNMTVLFVFTVGNMLVARVTTTERRMRRSGLILAATLFIVPLMNEILIVPAGELGMAQQGSLFIVLMIAEGCAAAANAIFQSSMYGLAGELQDNGDLMVQVEMGKGIAGICVLVVRGITKGIFANTPTGMAHSATVFFVAGACMALVAMALFMRMMARNKRAAKAAEEAPAREEGEAEPADEVTTLLAGVGKPWRRVRAAEYWHVLKAVSKQAMAVLLVFLVCLSCFPGLTSSLESHSWQLGDWFPLVLISIYNIGDLAGKTLPSYLLVFSAEAVHKPALLMGFYVPLFIFCVHRPYDDIFPVFLVFSLGLSTGYVSCCALIYGPEQVPSHQREMAGQWCALFLIAGLCGGSLLGMLISDFEAVPQEHTLPVV